MFTDYIDETFLKKGDHIHFIGIGGSGMFPLVQILKAQGHKITGSDNNLTDTVLQEREMGISVSLDQVPKNIQGADLIVYTEAILPDNPELMAAKESKIPSVSRSVLLGLLSRRYSKTIAVAGTHGKTTASSMLTQILLETNLDPSTVLGGKLPAIHGSGRVGQGELLIVESCEFADHFLEIVPWMAILLNIDADHLDYFKTLENIIHSFQVFAASATGPLVIHGDDHNTRKAIEGIAKPVITFGRSPHNDYYAADLHSTLEGAAYHQQFTLIERGEHLGQVTLSVPGEHNVINALAAIAAARTLGVSFENICRGLFLFHGASRRLEILGEINGVTIADDYAHHPAEIKATLQAVKELPYQEIWAIFQPFTYSRTAQLLEDFAAVLKLADHVLLTPIMGSREKNTYHIYSSDLAAKTPGSLVFDHFEEISAYALRHAKPGDLVLTMGCGDVYKIAKTILKMGLS